MENENLILIETFCLHHSIEVTFVTTLQNYGLVEIIMIEENQYLSPEKLADVEKMIRLHYVLDINIEGIEAIFHLLRRIDNLEQQLISSQNRITFLDHVR